MKPENREEPIFSDDEMRELRFIYGVTTRTYAAAELAGLTNSASPRPNAARDFAAAKAALDREIGNGNLVTYSHDPNAEWPPPQGQWRDSVYIEDKQGHFLKDADVDRLFPNDRPQWHIELFPLCPAIKALGEDAKRGAPKKLTLEIIARSCLSHGIEDQLTISLRNEAIEKVTHYVVITDAHSDEERKRLRRIGKTVHSDSLPSLRKVREMMLILKSREG